MKAIKLSKNGNVRYCEVSDTKIKKNWAKIKVIASGLCGSDIQKILYDPLSRKSLKTEILGHEFSGIIDEVYSNGKFQKNDKVAVIPIIFDKTLSITKSKSLGKDLPGGFAEYCLVPIKNLRKIPRGLSFELASLADVVAVSLHSYHLCGSPTNKKILIIGDGAVALSTAIVLKSKNNKVSVLGKNKRNMGVARKIGITTLNKLEKENSFDYVFECVGRSQDNTLEYSIKAAKPQGKIIVLGVFKKDYKNIISLRNLFFKEICLIGSNSYLTSKSNDDFNGALDLISRNSMRFSKLIANILPLKDFERGLYLFKNKSETGAIKIVFNPEL